MNKHEIARRLARRTGVSAAEAADQVDRLVTDILHKIRSGEPATLPGFGSFERDAAGAIRFRSEPNDPPAADKVRAVEKI